MKEFKCYDCDKVFESESSKEMLILLYTHYMSEHEDIIKGGSEEEKTAWMEKFNKDWGETKEIEEEK